MSGRDGSREDRGDGRYDRSGWGHPERRHSETDRWGAPGSHRRSRDRPPATPRRDPPAEPTLREQPPDPGHGHPRRGPPAQRRPEERPAGRPPLERPLESIPGPRRRDARGGRTPRSRLRRGAGAARSGPERVDGDPVQEAFAGRVDLYDIATWEDRTALDSVAVSLTGVLRTARTVALVGAALLLFVLQAVVAGAIVLEEPFIGVLAVSSVLPALAVAGYLWYGDPTRREPFVTLAATFVLSMLFASFAGVINTVLGPVFELAGLLGVVAFFFLVVGPVEEFVKWLAIRVYAYRTDAFQSIIDGVVYGAVAGVGFAAIENLIFIVTGFLEARDAAGIAPTTAATSIAAQRFLVGPGHVVFSAWAGFYLGLAKFNPENRGPIVVKGLLIAAFIHALYNTSVTLLPAVVPTVGLFGFIVAYHGFWFALLYRKVRAYRELYRARTADLPG